MATLDEVTNVSRGWSTVAHTVDESSISRRRVKSENCCTPKRSEASSEDHQVMTTPPMAVSAIAPVGGDRGIAGIRVLRGAERRVLGSARLS